MINGCVIITRRLDNLRVYVEVNDVSWKTFMLDEMRVCISYVIIVDVGTIS